MTRIPSQLASQLGPAQALQGLNLTLSAGGLAASALFAGPAFTAAYALGAALEAVNFRALCACATRLLSGQLGGEGGRVWVALMGLRLVMLLGAMGVALLAGAHPLGLLLGVSTVVPAVLIGAWWLGPPVDPTAPALPPDDPAWDHWSIWRADVVEPARDDDDLADSSPEP